MGSHRRPHSQTRGWVRFRWETWISFKWESTLRAKVKLVSGYDSTEIDMVVGDEVFVEAKLTERDFQDVEATKLRQYAALDALFDTSLLRGSGRKSLPVYQLVRNVLAAQQHGKRLAVIVHSDRTDLINLVLQTCVALRCQGPPEMRLVTWQEIAGTLQHAGLRQFLRLRYGI